MNTAIYKEVWDAQDACNSSGLIHFMAEKVVPAIWDEIHSKEYQGPFNEHPLLVVMVDKLTQLARVSEWDENVSIKKNRAYDKVIEIVGEN